ncbi:UDP-N-acetylglucosamine 1-carboxyvinyltransferase [bacterium]|nr:UDP-N-acetylglucosamine 1-carboxyvinyltransferase [bacterium]
MPYFEIIGGKKLKGEIEVRGSKNAATPILAATLLTKKKCVLDNVPLIEDVLKMIKIIKGMGAEVEWLGKRKISVAAKNIDPEKMDFEEVGKMRSSILLLGSLSARFPKFKMSCPGGCLIGSRPIGTHFRALEKMGVKIKQDNDFYRIDSSRRRAAKVVLGEFSVTATENALMLASAISQKTIIKIAAAEPHVQDLAGFLAKLGVKVKGAGTHTLEIIGRNNLKGAEHRIIPDANEAATFLIMGAATKSRVTVKNAVEDNLDLVLEKLREFGVEFEIKKSSITVLPKSSLKAVAKIDARIYPGIPTDIQAPLGVLATQAEGTTLIHDTLYEGRFKYIQELRKMGAVAVVSDPHSALITGPTQLYGKEIISFDLRAGASMIIAALLARGESVIKNIEQVDRGYEKIEKRLQKLGADIKRVE